MTIQEFNELKFLRIRVQRLLQENGNDILTYNILEEFSRMYNRFIYQNKDLEKEEYNEKIQ